MEGWTVLVWWGGGLLVCIIPDLLFALGVATYASLIFYPLEICNPCTIFGTEVGKYSTSRRPPIFSPVIYWVIMQLLSSCLAVHQHHRAGCWTGTLVYSHVKYFSSFHNSCRWKSHRTSWSLLQQTLVDFFFTPTPPGKTLSIGWLDVKIITVFLLNSWKGEMNLFSSFHWSQNIKFSLLEQKIKLFSFTLNHNAKAWFKGHIFPF